MVDVQVAINRYVAETNARPKPFTWTADPDEIIAAVRRGHQALDSIHLNHSECDTKTSELPCAKWHQIGLSARSNLCSK